MRKLNPNWILNRNGFKCRLTIRKLYLRLYPQRRRLQRRPYRISFILFIKFMAPDSKLISFIVNSFFYIIKRQNPKFNR